MRHNLYFIIAVIFLLVGCSTVKEVEIIKPKIILLEIPSALSKNCIITKPPTITVYTAAIVSEKEELLYQYSSALLKDLGKCNAQLKELRSWEEEQFKLHKEGIVK